MNPYPKEAPGKLSEWTLFAPKIVQSELPPHLRNIKKGPEGDITIWNILNAQPNGFDTTLDGDQYFSQNMLGTVADMVYEMNNDMDLSLDLGNASFRVLTDVDGPLESRGADVIYLIAIPKPGVPVGGPLSPETHHIFYQYVDYKSHDAKSSNHFLDDKSSWAWRDSVHVWHAWADGEELNRLEQQRDSGQIDPKEFLKKREAVIEEVMRTFGREIATRLLVKMGVIAKPMDASFNVSRISQKVKEEVTQVLRKAA